MGFCLHNLLRLFSGNTLEKKYGGTEISYRTGKQELVLSFKLLQLLKVAVSGFCHIIRQSKRLVRFSSAVSLSQSLLVIF